MKLMILWAGEDVSYQ